MTPAKDGRSFLELTEDSCSEAKAMEVRLRPCCCDDGSPATRTETAPARTSYGRLQSLAAGKVRLREGARCAESEARACWSRRLPRTRAATFRGSRRWPSSTSLVLAALPRRRPGHDRQDDAGVLSAEEEVTAACSPVWLPACDFTCTSHGLLLFFPSMVSREYTWQVKIGTPMLWT